MAHIPKADKVSITSMYLVGDKKLWWRTRVEDSSRQPITDWPEMKQELGNLFLPCNVQWLARDFLRRLRQTGSVREYVKSFQSLMLEVASISEEDKLSNFMAGLQLCVQNELRREKVNDLASAITVAESLMDFKGSSDEADKNKNSKGKKKFSGKNDHKASTSKANVDNKGKGKALDPGFFICGGPHTELNNVRRERNSMP